MVIRNIRQQLNELSECSRQQLHFRSISGPSSISDFAKPEIVNTRSLDDWNYPSEVDFEGLSDVDVPHAAFPVNKRAPPKPRIRNRAKASATATGSGPGPLTSGVNSRRPRLPPTSRVIGPSSSSTNKRHRTRRSSRSSQPPSFPSSSDSDDLVLHRRQLRPRPLPPTTPFGSAPADPNDQSGKVQSTTNPLSNATLRQLDDAIAVTAAQSPSQQAAALDSLLSAPPATDASAHPAGLMELDARRQSAQRFLHTYPSRPLPWHMAIVLANTTFAPQTVQQIQCHPVHWSPPSSPPASPASEPAPQMKSPRQKSSPVSAFPDVVYTSRRASSSEAPAIPIDAVNQVVPSDEL